MSGENSTNPNANSAAPLLALIGHPNVGKSTLFNALTGGRAQVGNYGGVTVSIQKGEFFTPHGHKLTLVDLPGCLSLDPKAADEVVTRDVLLGKGNLPTPDLLVAVADASGLERHLPLVLEVIERGQPVILVLNKIDRADQNGTAINATILSEELGIPVVPLQADKGKGLLDLKQALRFPFPKSAQASWMPKQESERAEARRAKVRELVQLVVTEQGQEGSPFSDKLDAELLHPWRGFFYLAAIFFLFFWCIFNWAEIPMGFVERVFGAMKDFVVAKMPPGLFTDLLTDGIIEGVSGVVVFLPQILLLFFFLGILESTGYMARAAFLMDGLMGKVGLSGRSFLPLLSGYACAIPGVMATRSIANAKERLLTIIVLPWMSCSARLPVYLLLIPLLVKGSLSQALILFGLYALGTITAFLAARLLRGTVGLAKDHQPSFLLELPPYRAPDWLYIFRHLLERAGSFLKQAGTLILAISVILWALGAFPRVPSGEDSEQFAYSAMGRIGQAIEPVVRPLGWDARLGTAMLASFAAREVFYSQVAISYAIEEADDEEATSHAVRREFRKSYRLPTVLSLLVFYVFALQCLPTSVVVARESKSLKTALWQLGGMSLFAYLAALLTYLLTSLFP